MSNMTSIVNSTNLNEVVAAIQSLDPDDQARIVLPWLQTGVRVTSRDAKATCAFGPTLSTYTDLLSRKVVLSALPLAPRDEDGPSRTWTRYSGYMTVLGFAFHEAGHLRFSDATYKAVKARWPEGDKDAHMAHQFSNVLDDWRLERNYIEEYPGTVTAIDASRRYMSGDWEHVDERHPKRAHFPLLLESKSDIAQVVTLAIAYEGYVAEPPVHNPRGGDRKVRTLYLAIRKMVNHHDMAVRRGIYDPATGVWGPKMDVVASHVEQVEELLRLYNRYAKNLPAQTPDPEPPVGPGGNEGPEGPDGGCGGIPTGEPEGGDDGEDGSDDGEGKSDTKKHPFRAPVAAFAAPVTLCADCGKPESDPVHAESGSGGGNGEDGGEDGGDETEPGKGKGGDGTDEDEDGKDPGKDPGKGKGKGGTEPGKEPGKGGDEPVIDPHNPVGPPGGNGAGKGKDELETIADELNAEIARINKDPFISDKDILSDGEYTGTIERNPDANPRGAREVGDVEAYLAETMRSAFLSTRFSRERYTSGFTRGRLRSRDACKAPAGIPNLFSQRADSSVTKVRLTIMLDYSGSMHGLLRRSDTFLRSLAEACNHIAAVRVSAWTYDDNDLVALWDKNEGEHTLAVRLSQRHAGNGTGTATCLAMLTDEVLRTALPGERQVILSVTDGEPNEGIHVVRTRVEEARDEGIEVLGVNIGNSDDRPAVIERFARVTEVQYGDNAIVWNAGPDAWSDLGDEVLTLIGEVLVGARTF